MQISIIDHNDSLTTETAELAERRLLFALARFDSKVDRVSLVVGDANGPEGGIDNACSVSVKLHCLPEVRVTCKDAEVSASIAHAADRAGRAVSRAIERSQQFDRHRF